MPRMKAFQCPLFPLETAAEINISDIEVSMETVNEHLTVLDADMEGLHTVLQQTKIGHESHLWGQEVDVDVEEMTEE